MQRSSRISGKIGGIKVGNGLPTLIMGAINLTGNSFFRGSVRKEEKEIVRTALEMQRFGASIIDVGARSTAPYRSYEVPARVEARLLEKAVKALSKVISIPISADTIHIEPARLAFNAGATILNDVYGLKEKDGKALARLVSSKNGSMILTAHEARTRTGSDPITRTSNSIIESLKTAKSEGANMEQIAIDPGIGFFSDKKISNVEWNCTIIDRLQELRSFQKPICIGVSRKKFIGKLSNKATPDERLYGSISATAISVYNGANIIRTHDVPATLDAVRVAEGIVRNGKVLATPGSFD